MPRKKTVNPQLTKALAAAETLKQANAAQQAELDQLREVVGQLTAAKPGRAFRARTLYHGDLDVKLRGAGLAESDVWIEHRGEVLVILVGSAARAAYSGGMAEIDKLNNSSISSERPLSDPAHNMRTERTTARPQVDLQELELQRVGLDATSLGANVSLFGQPLASVFTDDGRPVVNASVAPQGDPRRPGGWQDRSEVAAVAQQYGGYTGQGPRPAGWVDPDAQPS
jgi:hypothetical protein